MSWGGGGGFAGAISSDVCVGWVLSTQFVLGGGGGGLGYR